MRWNKLIMRSCKNCKNATEEGDKPNLESFITLI